VELYRECDAPLFPFLAGLLGFANLKNLKDTKSIKENLANGPVGLGSGLIDHSLPAGSCFMQTADTRHFLATGYVP
jgi:hypothetical protein